MTDATAADMAPPPLTRAGLMARLDALGLKVTTMEHPPAFTVAESSAIEAALPGAHTKNLFLDDHEGLLVLVVAKTTTKVDLKALSKRLKAGRFSFGKPDRLMQTLGVSPGSVTAFATVNDVAHKVKVVIDQELMGYDTINCHPLENTATTNIARDDLLLFIRSTGHDPEIMTVSAA